MKDPKYRIVKKNNEDLPCYFIQELRCIKFLGIPITVSDWRVPIHGRLKNIGYVPDSGGTYSYYKTYSTMESAKADIEHASKSSIIETVWSNLS